MITPILILIFLGIAVYFDVRYRGMSKFLPILFCGIGVAVNLIMGSKIDETFVLLLLLCAILYLTSFTRIYTKHDAMMLCAITLTTPFMGWMTPSVLCGILGVLCGFVVHLILCKVRNAEHPYIEIKNISNKKTKLARILSHVNGGQKFVVPAIMMDTSKEKTINIFGKKLTVSPAKEGIGEEKFNFDVSRSEMGKTDAKYVIPVIPLMPFFAGWYVLLMIMFLFS